MLRLIKFALIALAGLSLLLFAAGQAGFLAGQPPADLGVTNGMLKLPANNPNSVTSQAARHVDHPFRDYAAIAPIAFTGDGTAAFTRAADIVKALPRTTVVEQKPGYLYAQCQTRWLRFTDDLELVLDTTAGVIHVRSASRLGRGDFGVNRARIETIRAAMAS